MGRRTSRASRGLLLASGLDAREAPQGNRQLKGRIMLDRGAGVVEFPNISQFDKIAREEGLSPEDVDRAFGHLRRRRTSRSRRRVTKNARARVVRRGYMKADQTLDGKPRHLIAREVDVPPEEIEHFGGPRGVYLDIDGVTYLLRPQDAMRRIYAWFTAAQFKQAFGHLIKGSVLGTTAASTRRLPDVYGPRSMRLGHYDANGEVVNGLGAGSLILYHKPTGAIVWQAIDASDDDHDKPILIKHGARSRRFAFNKALKDAEDRNIAPLSFLQALGQAVDPTERREWYRHFSPRA